MGVKPSATCSCVGPICMRGTEQGLPPPPESLHVPDRGRAYSVVACCERDQTPTAVQVIPAPVETTALGRPKKTGGQIPDDPLGIHSQTWLDSGRLIELLLPCPMEQGVELQSCQSVDSWLFLSTRRTKLTIASAGMTRRQLLVKIHVNDVVCLGQRRKYDHVVKINGLSRDQEARAVLLSYASTEGPCQAICFLCENQGAQEHFVEIVSLICGMKQTVSPG
eukprot:NODE_17747_length_927_cov_5.731250.p1 GENE.NODE_17747_length_927_cov_5.731250~~NODE_17747_length_927_cov_5.731250.p1  ORF type:complete len:222 (-),score=24.95 NODE_17747_length_927_cov_5.731250:158-823(-)